MILIKVWQQQSSTLFRSVRFSSFNSWFNRQARIPLRNHLRLLDSLQGFKRCIWMIDWRQMFTASLRFAWGCGQTRLMVWKHTRSAGKEWCLAMSQSDYGWVGPQRRYCLHTVNYLSGRHARFVCWFSVSWCIRNGKAAAFDKKHCDIWNDCLQACWLLSSAN